MPKKIRELKALLRKAGFTSRPGKGSHTVWPHPQAPQTVTLSGDDARPYQEKEVQDAIKQVEQTP